MFPALSPFCFLRAYAAFMTDRDRSADPGPTAAGPLPRKAPGQTWESFADSLVSKAQREGAFDNLPGVGKPIPGLDEPFDPMWWAKQKLKRENIAVAPVGLDARRKIEQAIERIWDQPTESAALAAIRAVNADIRHANARHVAGPASTLAPLNEEATLERWRKRRPRENF